MSATGELWGRQSGDPSYRVCEEARTAFHEKGFVHLPGFLTESELDLLEGYFDGFVSGEIEVRGRDFCDMSGTYDRAPEDFAIVNIMLPRVYAPGLRGHVYEVLAASVAEQLCGPDMRLDYDQIVAKRPQREDARFEWHQDLAYWPETTETRTASFWLALDDTTVENGCLCFVPGSHLEASLRPHGPFGEGRDESHTLVAQLGRDDTPVAACLRRGDVTVHHERTLHGSAGNRSSGWRRGWVVAYRARTCVEEERAMGFTHSHNDDPDVLRSVGGSGSTPTA